MRTVRKIVLDIRSRPIQQAVRGNRSDWFLERELGLWQMAGSHGVEDVFISKPGHFVGLDALLQYLEEEEINPAHVAYVSDDEQAIERARKAGLLTIAIPPANATPYVNVSTNVFPDTDSLSGLKNLLEWQSGN